MKLKHWVWIAAGTWLVLRALKPPAFETWYQDMMLRAFGGDTSSLPADATEQQKAQFAQAADLAAKYLLPLGWCIAVAEVATGVPLETAIQKVYQKVVDMGPPADALPETLAKYKQTALDAAKVVT